MRKHYFPTPHRHFRFLFLLAALLPFLSAPAQTYLWQQQGTDRDGEAANDRSASSVSMPDAYTVAIGAPFNDGTGANAGHVRIYRWNGTSWVQKGVDIDGEAANDRFGTSVSMPDSNTVAIGAHLNDEGGLDGGHVRIYRWNGSNWIQKGMDIDAEAAYDYCGISVSMPDSNTVAIGASQNDEIGLNAGHVRIYRWNGSNWVQKGMDIEGEAAGDYSGASVSMPDSNTVAIGAPDNNGTFLGSGHVRIYYWDGSNWVQKGMDIDGEGANNRFGYSVSMPNSNMVAIGAPQNNVNGVADGHARVYRWNGTNWVQKGIDIDGEASLDRFGYSVSMPDSNTVGIGAYLNDGNGPQAGHTRIYRWNGNAWVQKGVDIDGEAAGNQSGTTVSMPDSNTVAIGAPWNNNNFTSSGHARIYSYNCFSTATLTVSSCGAYTAPSGAILSSSGTYTDVIPAVLGCDSVITINLTIRNTSSSISPAVCSSYTSPGGNTYTTSGTYTDTIPNAVGCDSLITINLTILNNSSSISPFVCSSYTSPGGNTYTVSGTYTDIIPNAAGCDSLITINLTVGNSRSSIFPVVCNNFTSPGGNTYTTSGTYTDTIPNMAGCDSVITINLTILNSSSSISPAVCSSYTSPGGNTYTTSGTYTDTIPNLAGCDSVITINLTILNSSSSISPAVCNSYTSPGGNTYTTSGTYTDTIPNAAGCDSVITINLTINNPPNTTATASAGVVCFDDDIVTLTGTPAGGSWSGPGVNGNTFDPSAAGNGTQTVIYNYTDSNGCTDSAQVSIVVNGCVGIHESVSINLLNLYPNPNNGTFTIELREQTNIIITDALGKIVYAAQLQSGKQLIDLPALSSGIYVLDANGAKVKVVLER
jgi:hypothetical protein